MLGFYKPGIRMLLPAEYKKQSGFWTPFEYQILNLNVADILDAVNQTK